MNMQFMIQYVMQFVGVPYHWGGDDPISGQDCSGLVGEFLMASGVIKRGTPKMNAQMLFNFLEKQNSGTYPCVGAIVFFGKSIKAISHVGFCIDPHYMIHAASGDSTTLTKERASEQNAFVRMDRVDYRKDLIATFKPRYLQMIS